MCNETEKKIILSMSKNGFKYEYEEDKKENNYIKVPFVVAADKINEFLKVRTCSAIDSVNKSKERRKFLKERMEKEKGNVK